MFTFCLAYLTLQAAVADQGAYITYQAGAPIAREGFRVLETGKSSAIVVRGDSPSDDPAKLLMKAEIQTKDGALTQAMLNFGQGRVLEIVVGDGRVTTSDGKEIPFDKDRPLYLAENLIWHTLQHVFRSVAEQETASAQLLVPTQGVVVELNLTEKNQRDDGLIEWKGSVLGLEERFVVDASGRVLYMAVPAQRAEIVRVGFEHLREGVEPPAPMEIKPNARLYTEQEVEVMTATNVYLKGTLTVPKTPGRHPAVLLISGSGPQDRDWNAPPAWNASLGAQIADRLAAIGCVVLRMDDRGVGGSTGKLQDASLSNLVSDASVLADYLKARPEVDPFKVILLGHSEGGVIAPLVAKQDPTIAGVILLAATSRPLDEIVIEQLTAQESDTRLPEAARQQAAAMIPMMKEAIQKAKDGERGIVHGLNLTWLREHIRNNPSEVIRQVRQPILIVQGTEDLKVLPRNARELAAAAKEAGNPDVTLVMIEGATHFFNQFPINNPKADPSNPEKPDPQLFEAITSWIRAHFLNDGSKDGAQPAA
ncbi:MAG: hypothetical protein KatS3mg015_0346 [Fimbriimonadales bacterium]|nr:MAG: hypothetical protein KatS3mg015_0346 [Fimbriimonadales bacterium]